MPGHLRKLTFLGVLATSGCGSAADREAAVREAEQAALARSEATARTAAALPATGLWTEAHLMDRLLRAGVAPRAREGNVPPTAWMGIPPVALRAGGGEVFAWIYADSVARRAVTDALDPDTGAPRGTVTPFAPPMLFVVQANLAAIITGGTDRNMERIQLALQAGLPVSP